ncbi:hypothetical protein GTA08_BOTSDO07233 [Botryosphaeria dothidea]|uniref:Uncharacterized protein n=1 Tax=Botryosphaeria dothidea TaxID=55169 RepID=A0A8H4IJB2_9PEZI|nr:hypothetical protein GTA08_BOTSDO11429 [Botryosphaeria dothidea]KAF4305673.1 hypothetical protein GTA08_BOTSDO07233 [Botryosphaeria dothidea]
MGDANSTTLFTFRIDVPSGVRSVELLGSWDNFTHSYRMERDPKRSSRHWYGIFTFKDIICDGEAYSGPEKREGGLKMGGTYWYHYMLDGVYEYHDETQPFTTTCPLHLGECVNILEVPYEEKSDDFDFSFPPAPVLTPAFTMDPKARFSTPRPNKFEALSRKPASPPPSPFFPSPVTPSCEGSSRLSVATGSDQSNWAAASVGSDSRPRTSYSRHGFLDRPLSSHGSARPTTADDPTFGPGNAQKTRHRNLRSRRPASVAQSDPSNGQVKRLGFSRNDSGISGQGLSGRRDNSGSQNDVSLQVGPIEQQDEQQSEQRRKEVQALGLSEDVLSESGATLACWKHKECLLRKRNGIAKTEAARLFQQDAYELVGAWIEHTTIALLDGEFPWDADDLSMVGSKSDFSDILEGSIPEETDGLWAAEKFPAFEDTLAHDDTWSFTREGTLARVDEEPNMETGFEVEEDPDVIGEPLHRCISETERFIDSFELPPVLTLDPSIQEIGHTLAPQVSNEELVEDSSSTGRFMESFILPPLDTQFGAMDNSFSSDPAESLHSATTNTTVDLPQLEDSAMLSSTCSSPATESSAWAESFRFWSDQDVDEDALEDSYLDYSSSATSPGLLPTVTHSRTNSWFSTSGFQGYSLPEDQYSSQATLTKITTQATIVRSESPPLQNKCHSTLRVNSELDGMDTLMNEFGFLSEAVI